jgi:predicted dehydrogenase
MNRPLRLGLTGFGKIAQDQHLPAIAGLDSLELVAVASRNNSAPGLPSFRTLGEMLASDVEIDAVILCQPPQARFAAARDALLAGKHVFLEKPPGATLSEVELLIDLARDRGLTLFASWHSREAAAVKAARAWCYDRRIESVRITWKEDVHVWHPGQEWIWQAGGFGVFDPGINALSILTAVVPEGIRLTSAALQVPSNKHAPVAAQLELETTSGVPISAEFDFLQTGPQSWDIEFASEDGTARLSHGGNRWHVDGEQQAVAKEQEYPALYRRFAELVRTSSSEFDLAPLRLVADAFLTGSVTSVSPFVE